MHPHRRCPLLRVPGQVADVRRQLVLLFEGVLWIIAFALPFLILYFGMILWGRVLF